MKPIKVIAFSILAAFAAQPALAHTGVGEASGFLHGIGHPIGGLDHVLAMIAVGVLAAQQGGRSVWLVPAAFVGMMLAGGLLGIFGVPVPFVEQGIIGSVLILGLAVALGRAMPVQLAMAMVGVLAIFHGHAHGTEMPEDASGAMYAVGFALATSVLHVAGIAATYGVQKFTAKIAPWAVRVSGGAIAAAGVGLAVL